jgi:hypothetical protein
MKTPSSMRNGRFHPSKCRGKVQKMGLLYIHSPKMPHPSSKKMPKFFLIKIKIKNWKKRGMASPHFVVLFPHNF